jgi:primosomal protein N''
LWRCFSLHLFRKNETKLANVVYEVKTSLEKIVVALETLSLSRVFATTRHASVINGRRAIRHTLVNMTQLGLDKEALNVV